MFLTELYKKYLWTHSLEIICYIAVLYCILCYTISLHFTLYYMLYHILYYVNILYICITLYTILYFYISTVYVECLACNFEFNCSIEFLFFTSILVFILYTFNFYQSFKMCAHFVHSFINHIEESTFDNWWSINVLLKHLVL